MFPACFRLRSVFIILLLFAFNIGFSYAQQPRYGGTLIFGSMGQPLSLDPGVIYDSESEQIVSQIYEPLVRYDSINNRFTPVLATGWQVSPDRKVWTFTLRKNVKFHDGTPFNSQAVKFSWERQMLTSHRYHNPSYGRFIFYRAVWGGYPGAIRKIDTPNDYTVQVTLATRCDNFLKIISHIQFTIVSPTTVMNSGAEFTRRPVGTGPFIFREWRDWMRIDLVANKNYWGGRPYLDHLCFEPFPGESTRYRLAKRGWVHILEGPMPKLIAEVNGGSAKELKIVTFPGTNFVFISLNCKKPPFNNPLVRKALNFAVNKPYVLRRLGESMRIAQSPLSVLLGIDVAGRSYPRNVEIARSLLRKAGYPNGFSMELWYIKVPRPYMASSEKFAQHIAENLHEVGINCTIRGVKWENYYEKLRYGEYQAAIAGIPGIDYDPELYFQTSWGRNNIFPGGTNYTFFKNDRVIGLASTIFSSTDKLVKTAAAQELQEILASECPFIPLYHNHTTLVVDRKVMGLSSDRNGIVDFSNIWLEK